MPDAVLARITIGLTQNNEISMTMENVSPDELVSLRLESGASLEHKHVLASVIRFVKGEFERLSDDTKRLIDTL